MDENYLDNLLDGMSTNNSKVNNDFEKRMDKDSDVEFDLGDLTDISLDELDDLDNLDLSDLEVDDIDFDDLDVMSLNLERKKTQEEDFNLDDLVEETREQDKFGDFSGEISDGDDVFSDADDELMNDMGIMDNLETQSFEEVMNSAEAQQEQAFETEVVPEMPFETFVPDFDDASPSATDSLDITDAPSMPFDNPDTADTPSQDVDNMDIDALFSALGIEDSEAGETEDYNKNSDALDDMFESATLGFDESMFEDIQDIGETAGDNSQKKKKKKNTGDEPKKKKTFSEILFGEPDEDDIEEGKLALIKKEQKKTQKEEKKIANEEKKNEKAHVLEMKKKNEARAKAEKAEKKRAEYEAELESEKGQKQVPTPIVIIIFVAFAAVGGLVYFGAQSFHYSQVIKKATDYFERQRYRLAYDEVSGVEVKKSDEELKDRIYTVMYVERLYESFENNMKLGHPDKALDALLRGIQKYDEHYEEAVELDIVEDVDFCMAKIKEALKTVYGLNIKQAYEMTELEGQEYIQAISKYCENLN